MCHLAESSPADCHALWCDLPPCALYLTCRRRRAAGLQHLFGLLAVPLTPCRPWTSKCQRQRQRIAELVVTACAAVVQLIWTSLLERVVQGQCMSCYQIDRMGVSRLAPTHMYEGAHSLMHWSRCTLTLYVYLSQLVCMIFCLLTGRYSLPWTPGCSGPCGGDCGVIPSLRTPGTEPL